MASKSPEPLNFKPNGIFYPVVSSCVTMVAGLSAILRKDKPTEFEISDEVAITSMFYPDAIIHPHQVFKNVSQGYLSFDYVRHSLCMMLANLAYESAKAKKLIPKEPSPEWELLRHVRNASSHNNRFNFRTYKNASKDEPKYPAYWENLIIDDTKKGGSNLLNGTDCFGEFMEMGELLALLSYIENKSERIGKL
jgi:hypothetical protein